ncbi:MAG: (2Fe-2S)-binding protein [Chloroflexi bacterium]|nr:(2Fe-2S)-binding protein [Chloroflexota bacterium]
MTEQPSAPGGGAQEEQGGERIQPMVTRREFLIGAGTGVAVAAAAAGAATVIRPGGLAPGIPGGAPGAPGAPVTTRGGVALPASMRQVNLNLNGTVHELTVDVRESLWETMTYQLGLASANLGCDRLQCGACAVVMDGKAVNGCGVFTARLGRGQKILTVDGIRTGPGMEGLHPIQRAFWQQGAFQCGICARGFIMSAYALLTTNASPTHAQIREGLAGNICRCSEYPKIYTAVDTAAAEMRSGPAQRPVMGPGTSGGRVDTSSSAV